MRLLATVAALALVGLPPAANAFVSAPTSRSLASLKSSVDVASELDETQSLVGVPNGASAIRSAVVTNSAGDFVRVDDAIRSSKAGADAPQVVIYLRHMGCPYCWSYAKEWCSIQQELEEAGIGSPIFVSIGDAEKLNSFLDANSFIPKEQMFVDDYSFDAYKTAGFSRFDQLDKDEVKDVKMTAPELGFGEWINYFSTVGKVSPIPKDMKFGEFPEGVAWTGGTFVIQGDTVLYQWSDKVPGNHPVVGDVVKIAKEAAKNEPKKENARLGKVGWF